MKSLLRPFQFIAIMAVLAISWLADRANAALFGYMANQGLVAFAAQPTRAGAVTLLEYAKSLDPNGAIARVIEMLAQSNEVVTDLPWIEGNLPTGHRTTIRTGLPTVVWRQLYKGVPPSKSTRAQVDDACGMLQARSEVDVKLANLHANPGAFRLSEAQAFVEAMNQAFCDTLIYGNATVNPERFTGLAQRYSSLSAGNGANIVDAGGTGANNTSVWLVVWGENTVHGIYPKGSKAGLAHQDLGEIDAFDDVNARYRAYADLWSWDCGLSLRDWRYVVRIANINVADLRSQANTQAGTAGTLLPKAIVDAMARIPFMGMGKAVLYGNRTAKAALAKIAMDKSQNVVTIEPAVQQFGQISPGSFGNGQMSVLGVPFRTVDRILNTEARVV